LHAGDEPAKAAAAWRDVLDVDPEHRLARRRLEESREKVALRSTKIQSQD